MSIKLGNTNIPFVFRGNEVIHPAPVKDGLVLWYDFSGRTNDDAQRDVAEDLSGNGNHGTLQNFNYTSESGYDKNKLSFDGVDDYVETQHTQQIDFLNDITLEVVFRTNTIGKTQRIIDKYWSYFSLALWSNNSINFNLGSLDSGNNHTTLRLSPDKLYHIAASYRESTGIVTLSINNTLDSEHQNSGQLGGNQHPLLIGSNDSGQSLDGYIYSSRIYNRPLTPEEIAHNYAIEKERFNIE